MSENKQTNFCKAYKAYKQNLKDYTGKKFNVRLIKFNSNLFDTTIFFADNTIINKMKGEIIA